MPKDIVPKEALDWFKRKGIEPGFDYRDVWRQEHSNAFTVAKMLNADLLTDVKAIVEQAIEEGQTFEQFREILKPLLVKSGWWGIQEMVDPLSGDSKPVQLGSEGRLKTIYKTNMRTARAAGQWERIERTKRAMPYLLYQLGPSIEHRLQHEKWKGLLLPVDDAWWNAHMPPNGWGCKCWIRQLSRFEADKLIKEGKVSTSAPHDGTKRWVNKRTGEVEVLPEGIEPGWDYNPGKSREASLSADLAEKELRMRQTLSEGL
ncbi:phage head morphogenesis protein [Vibrio parahaemolyticus]|uniref:phage head morphogenesis protein n=1 Tax=Vibrio parahaemolyticus TaxID=670 RepID=UPI0028DEB9C6|nr:phage minor head protein [Vibrio parahaemolyticus]MDT8844787.1 phage minor head protein [Vibrio parahaemolyticus]MDT8917147.1 phage minor head protein [Vibrio parahaemolyticus]